MTGPVPIDGPGSWVWEVVETILQAGLPVALVCTGGGSQALGWLLNHPGASRAVVEAQIPYHHEALATYLQDVGPHRVAEDTARRLALTAHNRAREFSGAGHAIGIGVTAALATQRERRGADRAFVATRGADRYDLTGLQFDRGAGRLAQEDILSRVMLTNLLRACDRPASAEPGLAETQIQSSSVAVDGIVEAVLDAGLPAAELRGANGAIAAQGSGDRVLVSGSFDPLHDGHLGLAAAAERISGRQAAFELSVRNVDKPALAYRQVMERAAQSRRGRSLMLTREPTFVGKAHVLPGSWFAIGFDTAVRLVDPAYYDGTVAGMENALQELRALGTRFMVASRLWEGDLCGLSQVHVPTGFDDLFAAIPPAEFRLDISSTALRAERTTA